MKTTFVFAFLIWLSFAAAQDTWNFKSSQDSFTVTSQDGHIAIGDSAVNSKVFNQFLKILLRANRGDCPTVDKAELTVEAKSGSTVIVKKFYPTEGAIESNGKCATLDYDEGWSLPFHREWLISPPNGHIPLGDSLSFKSDELKFDLFKKGEDWSIKGGEFIPNLLRMKDFVQTADNFKVEKRYSKKIKDSAKHSFRLSTGRANYNFYLIEGMWTVEFPKGASLVATRDFAMLGRFARSELGDNRSSDIVLLGDKSADAGERIQILEKLQNVDSPVFKSTLHKILRDPEENAALKERVASLLVDRPSADNLAVLFYVLEKSTAADQQIVSKVLRRLNPAGPLLNGQDETSADEKIKKWKEWYAKYKRAQGI